MSFRIRDIQAIHNNPLNKSTSKQMFSIPRAQRFNRCKTVLSDQYYEIPSTNQQKAPSFTHAIRKSTFDKKDEKPSPCSYTVKDIQIQNKMISFPHGRSECKLEGFLEAKEKTPGPGDYNPNPEVFGKVNSTLILQAQRNNIHDRTKSETPGPGAYPTRSTWLQKQKILSTQKKRGCPLIRKSSLKRTLIFGEVMDTPFYNTKSNSRGSQTFMTTGGFSIGKSQRFKPKRTITEVPGPGSQQSSIQLSNRFSEFI